MGDLFYVETFISRCNIVIYAGYCLLVDQARSNTSWFFKASVLTPSSSLEDAVTTETPSRRAVAVLL